MYFMRVFFRQYRSAVIIITVLLALIAGLAYGAYYLSNMIRDKSVMLKQSTMDYALTQKDARDIVTLRDSRNYIDTHRDILKILLPNTDDDKVRLFATIEQLAQESGTQEVRLAVQDTAQSAPKRSGAVAPSEEQEGDATTSAKTQNKAVITPSSPHHMLVTVSVTGSYPQVLTFMSRVENMPYLADIVRVRMTKQTANDLSKEQPLSESGDASPPKIDTIAAEMDVAFYVEGNS